jgi:hypothetical protein
MFWLGLLLGLFLGVVAIASACVELSKTQDLIRGKWTPRA